MDILLRFVKYVDVSEDCWVWTGFKKGKGYGGFMVNGRSKSAHRVSYELFVGPIPEGMQLDHLCMNKLCVNPSHLEPVTNKENQYRAYEVRGHWPVEGREPEGRLCPICNEVFSTIFVKKKYCSNACNCKAKRRRKVIS